MNMASTSMNDVIARWTSRAMLGICIFFTVLILALLILVTGYLVSIGFKSISWSFFTEVPGGDPEHPGGMRNAIEGTAILVGLAGIVGIPMGMLAGIYLAEYSTGSRLATPVRFISDVLAGVPSIVVGILGYELLVVPLGSYNGWAGALALAFIMIPIVARTTEEMLLLVPNSYREASIALGATKARTILQVVVPSATGSIITGVMLAIARVAGETAPLLFTALGSRLLTRNPNLPFPSLTVQIFAYATGPYEPFKRQAWAGILVLISLIFVLNLVIRYVTRGRRA
ncbi:MAG TPA: phosphate ABC transporter permease PstA [Tepidisphaeraceae bacterium]|nr:phosphate ABC transporter permease PstA [Tepidisphaeraceae bacterium]